MTSTVITSYYEYHLPRIDWAGLSRDAPACNAIQLLDAGEKVKFDITTDDINYLCNSLHEYKELLWKYEQYLNEEHLNVFKTVNAPFNEELLRKEQEEKTRKELSIQLRTVKLQRQRMYFEKNLSNYQDKMSQYKNDSIICEMLQKAITYYTKRINDVNNNHYYIDDIGCEYVDIIDPNDNNNDNDDYGDTNTNNGDDEDDI
jgi:hypothetical protein